MTDAGALEPQRYRIVLGGAVQGVGLRPFVYRLARSLALGGYVQNSSDGVVIEVEGEEARLSDFAERLARERPAAACVTSQESRRVAPLGAAEFVIAGSDAGAVHAAGLLNDLATCPACLEEILDPSGRRYLYPFTTCTSCGPRFTIAEALPYDRASTTMRGFAMCAACRAEYEDPQDRRFHAQPIACPACNGAPRLGAWRGLG